MAASTSFIAILHCITFVKSVCYCCARLQALADALVDRFVSAGLMERQYDRVKLHITVMNTLFRKDSKTTSAQNFPHNKVPEKERESFDARKVLEVCFYYYGSGTVDRLNSHRIQL